MLQSDLSFWQSIAPFALQAVTHNNRFGAAGAAHRMARRAEIGPSRHASISTSPPYNEILDLAVEGCHAFQDGSLG